MDISWIVAGHASIQSLDAASPCSSVNKKEEEEEEKKEEEEEMKMKMKKDIRKEIKK